MSPEGAVRAVVGFADSLLLMKMLSHAWHSGTQPNLLGCN
jgi:hypothetical protein